MNIANIRRNIEFSSESGLVIPTEKALILENYLINLQNENHFHRIYYWGCIFGTLKDYYIAYGYHKDALLGRIYYYSMDGKKWGLLPLAKEKATFLAQFCFQRFKGDPTELVNVSVDDGKVEKLKEEDRLAATVALINHDSTIVPRGGLFRRPDGVVVENRAFEGLEVLESYELQNYLHYRIPTKKWNINLLIRENYNYAIDFLDAIDSDVPEGCWINVLSQDESVVNLKSLYWLGMAFRHTLKTSDYNYCYIGNGKKSVDLPFTLQ